MKNLPLLVITIVGTLLLVVMAVMLFTKSGQSYDLILITGDRRHSRGSATAQVVVTEFSDFQCPACSVAHQLLAEVYQKYPDQVQVIYRHYPLSTIHPNAQLAAQAAEAAGEMNKFWEMHDKLFTNQQSWESLDESAFMDLLGKYAEELQIDKSVFLTKIQSGPIKQKITNDINDGDTLGINSTPTFFVNGQKTAAPQLLSTVESSLKK